MYVRKDESPVYQSAAKEGMGSLGASVLAPKRRLIISIPLI
jgi:hypothetical protein